MAEETKEHEPLSAGEQDLSAHMEGAAAAEVEALWRMTIVGATSSGEYARNLELYIGLLEAAISRQKAKSEPVPTAFSQAREAAHHARERNTEAREKSERARTRAGRERRRTRQTFSREEVKSPG
jgi:hypothetical protein